MGALQKASWLFNRLLCMSPAEVLYRVRQKLDASLQQRGLFIVQVVPEPIITGDDVWINSASHVDVSSYCRAADRMVQGHMDIFALDDADIGAIPEWNRDPRTGVTAPLKFGKTLNYRDESLVGDIKYLWEPNRHLQLVRIAQAYALSGDDKYLDNIAALLISWFDQCPYMKGPNWTSSLELGIRLINWSIVWQLVGGTNSKLFDGQSGNILRQRWLESIYQHCDFIHGHYSKFSSANNHLIGEAAGLFIASVSWPFWRKTQSWQKHAHEILQREALKQNSEDGVNREQAVSYQQFVLDFLILSGLAAKKAGCDFPAAYWQRVEAMLDYLFSLMDVSGNVPMIGDADDGYVVALDVDEKFCPYRSLLATGSILFGRPEFLLKAGEIDGKTRWLLGNNEKTAELEPKTQSIRRSFADGGYYILGGDIGLPDEVHCVIDCGPLGYTSIAAHGHADALAMTLACGGHEFLIDPGTYAYHTQKHWRDYFRGTAAHNTIRVDGLDQSQSGGNFMWLAKATANCSQFEEDTDGQVFLGEHDGYKRLPDPVIHKRKVGYKNSEKTMQVIDFIECIGEHLVERMWHFSENCLVSIEGRQLLVKNNDKSIAINLATSVDGSINIYQGSESPTSGWISRRFDRKEPITTVVESYTISGATELTAVIDCHPSV